jgi:hypothetical protein
MTKITGFKFPDWFTLGLNEAKKETDKRDPRNGAEIIIRATCKAEKDIKMPRGYKFRSAYKTKD